MTVSGWWQRDFEEVRLLALKMEEGTMNLRMLGTQLSELEKARRYALPGAPGGRATCRHLAFCLVTPFVLLTYGP